ncbi:hypothetical protein [Paraburkholderia azotifigens]|uniref:Lipoprotein n=1 Tax=Paraburkholderia azotifigens TaxID=2057004 RepID=A0A5C6VEJ4_9BURK|nr:hypothetical protein [Paraburkholderia azotifigens]TXC83802.1 hypothetical protein FRZ40_25990 [Paraburkholderia azotifigens]
MRTETRKIAGIATMLCGSMVTFGAHAFEQSVPPAEAAVAPDLAGGAVEPLAMRAAAPANEAPDAITQAVVDALSTHKPRAFADDTDGLHPVSYARPIVVPSKGDVKPVVAGAADETARPAPIKEARASVAQTQGKAPVSYAAPIAVPIAAPPAAQAARNDTHPGARHEAKAQVDTEDPNWSSKTTVAISEEKLDTMRGGFDVANGLKVSFGISRMAVVNGNLVTQTSFNIPDLSNMTTQQAQALAAANMGSLLQNGVGNVAQQGSVQGLSGAVIQNTLSNQNIQTLTTINAAVNSLGLFKNMNLGSTLNNALLNSVRPR